MVDNISEVDEQEIVEIEEIRLQWLASAKRRNLAPHIIDILSRPTTLEDLRMTRGIWNKIDKEAAALGIHRFQYLAQASKGMRDISMQMLKAELARKVTAE